MMKKLNKKEIIKITAKLKPFWKEYWKISSEFNKKILNLQKKMNKKLKIGTELEFFYVDGECAGIGAKNYSDRKFFPLIQSNDLL